MELDKVRAVLLADGWHAVEPGTFVEVSTGITFMTGNKIEIECLREAVLAKASGLPRSAAL